MQKSTTAYIKAISKRSEIEGKEKVLPIGHMGGTMISHGEDFEAESELGQCLSGTLTVLLSSCFADLICSIRQDPGTACQE
jgi:hypothetical protein